MKITIIGCGWLGIPLAKHLIAQGHQVHGTTTQKSKLQLLTQVGIKPLVLDLQPEISDGSLDALEAVRSSDIVVIDIPPKTRNRGGDFHPAQISNFLPVLQESNLKHLVYVSSTSVYSASMQVAKEEDATQEANPALYLAERMLKSKLKERCSIVRAGGLMGYDRVPMRYYAHGRPFVPDTRVNYIHRDDLINIIKLLIDQKPGQIYNAVAPLHPTKKELYNAMAQRYHFGIPSYATYPGAYKLVSHQKLVDDLSYEYQYPDPCLF